ncbi:MAG: UPF0175 family protein [Chloroflexi bacterium]|nr:UPF0175 family protein [Chloroflexota bacterium]
MVVELSDQILRLLAPAPEEAAIRLKELALIDLVRRGEVSSGWAAETLGVSKTDFRKLLVEHDVPYVDLSEEELRQQVEAAMPQTSS